MGPGLKQCRFTGTESEDLSFRVLVLKVGCLLVKYCRIKMNNSNVASARPLKIHQNSHASKIQEALRVHFALDTLPKV